ncbi:hypothetical protein N599_20385 [Saccharopolyspora erythraea D]|nr:hypothetical protein N599_20385 [Saccharopolyspora erythraea D]
MDGQSGPISRLSRVPIALRGTGQRFSRGDRA